jgi:hypothetical protein
MGAALPLGRPALKREPVSSFWMTDECRLGLIPEVLS